MAKVTLDPIGSLENQTSAVQVINENFDRIEEALENTYSRDGTGPNQLQAPLDANSQRLTNLPAPEAGSDAARWADVTVSFALQGKPVPSTIGNANKFISTDGTNLVWMSPGSLPGVGDMKGENNLSELTDTDAARTALGLNSAAILPETEFDRLSSNVTKTGNMTMSGQFYLGGTKNHVLVSDPEELTMGSIGFRGVPLIVQDTDYTFVLNDAGMSRMHTAATAHNFTIPPNSAVNYPPGTILVADNIGAGVLKIMRGAGVAIRFAGSGTSQDINVAQYGSVFLRQLSANVWLAQGSNLS